jgi:hypothetical protein
MKKFSTSLMNATPLMTAPSLSQSTVDKPRKSGAARSSMNIKMDQRLVDMVKN